MMAEPEDVIDDLLMSAAVAAWCSPTVTTDKTNWETWT